MESQTLIGVVSSGVAALAIAVNTVTTIISLRNQRAMTKSTLDTQISLAQIQEAALRERTHGQDLREHRAPVYAALLRWATDIWEALSYIEPENPELPKSRWQLDTHWEDQLDLYASDVVHIRFNALRGLLLALVEGVTPQPKIVTWKESNGEISNISLEELDRPQDWPARERVRDQAIDATFRLIGGIRAETQGADYRGYFINFRMSND